MSEREKLNFSTFWSGKRLLCTSTNWQFNLLIYKNIALALKVNDDKRGQLVVNSDISKIVLKKCQLISKAIEIQEIYPE